MYNLFFHPLAKEPGPLLCRISGIPTFYYACRGDRHIWQWRMFKTYGDQFRAAPNLLLFRSSEAYNCVFSPSTNVKKSPFYDVWRRNVHDLNTLACTDVALHARRRKALALAFTDQSVKATIPYMERHVDRWNELMPGDRFDADGWSGLTTSCSTCLGMCALESRTIRKSLERTRCDGYHMPSPYT
jgi:cytochrome P450